MVITTIPIDTKCTFALRQYFTTHFQHTGVVCTCTFVYRSYNTRTRLSTSFKGTFSIRRIFIIEIKTVKSINIGIHLQFLCESFCTFFTQTTHTGIIMITQNRKVNLDTFFLQRTDDFICMLQYKSHLVVAIDIRLTVCTQVHVSSKYAHDIEERFTTR